jgi:hypothetical protein
MTDEPQGILDAEARVTWAVVIGLDKAKGITTGQLRRSGSSAIRAGRNLRHARPSSSSFAIDQTNHQCRPRPRTTVM